MEKKILQLSNLYVATLRQIYLTHQYSHWTTRGDAFYGDHLVFERLYKSAADDADSAAEKMIGLFGAESVNYDSQRNFMTKLAEKYSSLDGEPVKMSLAIEKHFLDFSKEVYKAFDDDGVLSLGLDDLIMQIASSRETSVYLLNQILNK